MNRYMTARTAKLLSRSTYLIQICGVYHNYTRRVSMTLLRHYLAVNNIGFGYNLRVLLHSDLLVNCTLLHKLLGFFCIFGSAFNLRASSKI